MVSFRFCLVSLVLFGSVSAACAQDMLPADNGLEDYHTQPRWRESESHPLRVAAYIFHPIGWLAREVIFRPLSYFASSTEVTRSVMGYREPYDYRQPECFSAEDSVPDCRATMPFDYERANRNGGADSQLKMNTSGVYFPNVNFDFDKRAVNAEGKSRCQKIAETLRNEGSVHVVLQGHTDSVGTEEYNKKLGMDRAEAVRGELTTLGIAQDRLSTVTFGESQPLEPGNSPEAMAANRRVEVHPTN